jgi:hypothetical protein
LLPEFVGNGS